MWEGKGRGVCIRLFAKDEKDGLDSGSGYSDRGYYWIRGLSDFEELSLPADVIEQLESFWYRQESVLLIQNQPNLLQAGFEKIVVERVTRQRSLIVFGAGHVGRSIALMGAMLGLRVILADDRPEFLNKDDLSSYSIELLTVDFDNLLGSFTLDKQSAVVIVTRGHQSDETILRQIASYEVGYVGMIGSRRRVEGVFRRLRQQGIEESFLGSVKAPIGLEIGARTPQEIAIAVHAEIIKHFNVDA